MIIHDEQVQRRYVELIKQGVDPDSAYTIAMSEKIQRDQQAEADKEKSAKELETVISEGHKVVGDLKKIRDGLEEDITI